MKLQLMKEVSYSGSEISWNIWTTRTDGTKISCLSCHSSEEEAVRAFEERAARMAAIPKNFTPEIIKEIEI